jgi:hypothetical protein
MFAWSRKSKLYAIPPPQLFVTEEDVSMILRQSREVIRFPSRSVVAVNNGGPYGSSVLKGVMADSDRVMRDVFQNTARRDWHKASIKIMGSEDSSKWTAKAVLPGGSLSITSHVFRR